MNNERRKQVKIAMNMLTSAKEILNDVFDDEQDAYDNLPENLQGSMRASDMEDAISEISDAIDTIDEAYEMLEGVI